MQEQLIENYHEKLTGSQTFSEDLLFVDTLIDLCAKSETQSDFEKNCDQLNLDVRTGNLAKELFAQSLKETSSASVLRP